MSVYVKDPQTKAQACVIWMHGLGADAQNMMGIADVLISLHLPVRHVFVDAPVRPVTLNQFMPTRAWYDIVGLTLHDREDRHGILQSEQMIQDIIASQIAEGFTAQQIYVAGFSQGGAMALFIGLRSQIELGGVISLSAYLPLRAECQPKFKTMPIFMAMGEHDLVVVPALTRQSYEWLVTEGLTHVSWHQYPMEHMICIDEIRDISQWIHRSLKSMNSGETE